MLITAIYIFCNLTIIIFETIKYDFIIVHLNFTGQIIFVLIIEVVLTCVTLKIHSILIADILI